VAPHSHKQQQTPRPHPSNRGKECPNRQRYLSGRRILPKPITGKEKASQLLDGAFLAYNAARLREGCELLVQRILQPDVTVAMSLAGALTPAGLGCSCIVPLIKAGFVDWIVSTGANLYHDLHFAFNLPLHAGRHFFDDTDLRRNDLVRIYDVLLGHSDCLLATDEALRQILMHEEFQQTMGTARLHHLIGKYAAQAERASGLKDVSVLAAAYRCGVPIYTSSPGDSAIGMIIAGMALEGYQLRIDPVIDVNETASIVLAAKRNGGKSAVLLIGGGSPKNFVLQTEPHIQEILRLEDTGHDYFFQVTDARPDTGGLSGATPSEAVSWGKVDPSRLPDAVVCYADSTIALPLITHYVLANRKPRPLRRLYDQRPALLEATARAVADRRE
jgi:deoxyhypusine synthase